jgi:dihydrofolate reductase
MIVSLIVAASDNEVIGANGTLPWHLPEDMRRFRRLTTGHVVIMGRLTYESILARLGKPLPRRTSVVVSHSPARHAPPNQTPAASPAARDTAGSAIAHGQVRWAESLEAALELATALGGAAGNEEFFVAGGVTVYAGALPFADRIYLTRVHGNVAGDRSMPPGWLAGFRLARAEPASDPAATLPYEWLDYERRSPGIASPGGTVPGPR